jgi:hypothetical protein
MEDKRIENWLVFGFGRPFLHVCFFLRAFLMKFNIYLKIIFEKFFLFNLKIFLNK